MALEKCNGIVINGKGCREYGKYITAKCQFNSIGDNTYEIIKSITRQYEEFQWCGFTILPNKISYMLSFDIMFMCDVPTKYDYMSIKTQYPPKTYTNWITQCQKNEFVTINLPIMLYYNANQCIMWNMENCKKALHFLLKNVNITPINKTPFYIY